jgi:hypothetical protein
MEALGFQPALRGSTELSQATCHKRKLGKAALAAFSTKHTTAVPSQRVNLSEPPRRCCTPTPCPALGWLGLGRGRRDVPRTKIARSQQTGQLSKQDTGIPSPLPPPLLLTRRENRAWSPDPPCLPLCSVPGLHSALLLPPRPFSTRRVTRESQPDARERDRVER